MNPASAPDDKPVFEDLDSREVRRVAADDDTVASLPTWAPYGQALTNIISDTRVDEGPTAVPATREPPPTE